MGLPGRGQTKAAGLMGWPLQIQAPTCPSSSELGISRVPLLQLCCRKPELPAHGQPARRGCPLPATPPQSHQVTCHVPRGTLWFEALVKIGVFLRDVVSGESAVPCIRSVFRQISLAAFTGTRSQSSGLVARASVRGGMNRRGKPPVTLQQQRATLPKDHLLSRRELAHRNPIQAAGPAESCRKLPFRGC